MQPATIIRWAAIPMFVLIAAAVQAQDQARPTVPAGTVIYVRTAEPLDSKKSNPGQSFATTLETDLAADGKVIAPKGSQAFGMLIKAKAAGRAVGKAELAVELTSIVVNGQAFPVVTETMETEAKKSEGRKTLRNAAVGAGIGAVADDSEGAKKGAAIGAGVSVLTKGTQVQIPAGSVLQFRLMAPFTP